MLRGRALASAAVIVLILAPSSAPAARNGRIYFLQVVHTYHHTGFAWYSALPTGAGVRTERLDGRAEFAAWSPDGRELAYQVTTGLRQSVWVSAANGSGAHELAADAVAPGWTPSGDVLWTHDSGATGFLASDCAYTQPPSGGAPSVVFCGAHDPGTPYDLPLYGAWLSPDGTRLAYLEPSSTSSSGFDSKLYIAAPDGSGARQLVADNVWLVKWSPDGARLVVRVQPSTGASYDELVDAATGRVVKPFRGAQDVAFAPDGSELGLIPERTGLELLDANGAHPHVLRPARLPFGELAWRPA